MKKETIKKMLSSNLTCAVIGGVGFWIAGKLINRGLNDAYREGFSAGRSTEEFRNKLQQAVDAAKPED